MESFQATFGIYQSVEAGSKGRACHDGRLPQSRLEFGTKFGDVSTRIKRTKNVMIESRACSGLEWLPL